MASSFGSGSDDEIVSAINVTPLVDVVLVLLVIFMMTAPVIYQSAIKVQLPQAKTGESGEKSALEFSLSKEGEVYWGKEKTDWPTLEKRLAELKGKVSDQTAIIGADQATPHGTVIRLMDVLRSAGLTRFALTVESPTAAK